VRMMNAIFRPLALLVWEEEEEVTDRHGTSCCFAMSHNEISTSFLTRLVREDKKLSHFCKNGVPLHFFTSMNYEISKNHDLIDF